MTDLEEKARVNESLQTIMKNIDSLPDDDNLKKGYGMGSHIMFHLIVEHFRLKENQEELFTPAQIIEELKNLGIGG